MAEGHIAELVYVEREDGLGLEGAMMHPQGSETRKKVAILWFHGNTSRFYDLPYIHLGRELAEGHGYAFITCNTHGHDVTSVIWGPAGEATPGGACWERFDEVPLDIAPWIALALEKGFAGVVLAGHSFGANKVVYYAAHTQDERVIGVIAASPDVKWKAEPERVQEAERMVADGQGSDLTTLVEGNPSWYRLSAQTLLARARIAAHVFSSATQEPYVASVSCPLLAFFGTNEAWLGGETDLEMIRRNSSNAPRVDTRLIEGADHVYWGKAKETAALIAGWVDTLGA
ncbi:MAG TPA: alpha/beta fold hydrolase [Chloroflexia bacterium]|nr:alpha/beta fold hydrolase [Chloroflexia bacterium]